MSKKMWNKIFKTKSSKTTKTLVAATKVNKRCSIYEEYQQLNAALDLTNNDKTTENSSIPKAKVINYEDTPLPTSLKKLEGEPGKLSTQKTTLNKVFTTLKRSQNTGKEAASTPNGNSTTDNDGKRGNEKGDNTNRESALNEKKMHGINNNNDNNNTKIPHIIPTKLLAKTKPTKTTNVISSTNLKSPVKIPANSSDVCNGSETDINNITTNHSNFIDSINSYNIDNGSLKSKEACSTNIHRGSNNSNGANTPSTASLSHQLTASANNKAIKNLATIENCSNNYCNENEKFACKNLLSNHKSTTSAATATTLLLPKTSTLCSASTSDGTCNSTSTSKPQRLSKIVIVVRKLNTTSTSLSSLTTPTPAITSDLTTNNSMQTKTNTISTETATNFTTNNDAVTEVINNNNNTVKEITKEGKCS